MSGRILCQLKSDTGELLGAPIDLPLNVDKLGLEKLCQALLSANNNEEIEEDVPYSFFVDDREILSTLEEVTNLEKEKNFEKITEIVYQPQALFKVRSVTRCSSTIEGHTEAVISVAFSPDGKYEFAYLYCVAYSFISNQAFSAKAGLQNLQTKNMIHTSICMIHTYV